MRGIYHDILKAIYKIAVLKRIDAFWSPNRTLPVEI